MSWFSNLFNGNTDWDISHSALDTGQGTPWGPTTQATPGAPPTTPPPADINQFPAFDQSAIVKNLIGNLRSSQAAQDLGAEKQSAQLGLSNSDALRGQLQENASNTQQDATNAGLQAAQTAWNSQLAQKNTADALNEEKYKDALSAWATQSQAYQNEQASRNAAYGQIASAAAAASKYL